MNALNSKPANDVSADERRRAPRQRAFLRAKIAYIDGSITFDCSVTQISESGLRIMVTKDVNIPDRVRIDVPQKRLSTLARLVRRDSESAALAFEAEPTPTEANIPMLLERIRLLEAQNKMLKATCDSLTAQIESNKSLY